MFLAGWSTIPALKAVHNLRPVLETEQIYLLHIPGQVTIFRPINNRQNGMNLLRLVILLVISCASAPSAFSKVSSWEYAAIDTYYGKQWLLTYAQSEGIEITEDTRVEQIYQLMLADSSPIAKKVNKLINSTVENAQSAAKQFGVSPSRADLSDIERHFIALASYFLGGIESDGTPASSSKNPISKISAIDKHLINSLDVSDRVKNDIRSYLKLRHSLAIKRETAFLEGDSSLGVSEEDTKRLEDLFEKVLTGLKISYDSETYHNPNYDRNLKVFWIEPDIHGARVNKFFHSITKSKRLVEAFYHAPAAKVLERANAMFNEQQKTLDLSDRMIYTGKPLQTGIHELRHAYFAYLRANNIDSLHSGTIKKHIIEELPWHYEDHFSLEELDTWLGDLHYWSSEYSRVTDFRLAASKKMQDLIVEKALVLKHISLQTAELTRQFIRDHKDKSSTRTEITYQHILESEEAEAPVGIYYEVSNEVASLKYQLLGPEYQELALDIAIGSPGVKARAEKAIMDRIRAINKYSNKLVKKAQKSIVLASTPGDPKLRAQQVKVHTQAMKSYSNPYASFTGSRCRAIFE